MCEKNTRTRNGATGCTLAVLFGCAFWLCFAIIAGAIIGVIVRMA